MGKKIPVPVIVVKRCEKCGAALTITNRECFLLSPCLKRQAENAKQEEGKK